MYKKIGWFIVILWGAVIFYLSHQPAHVSNGLSTRVTEEIVEKVERVVPDAEFNIREVNRVVRKNAHFFIFFVLGILVMFTLRRSKIRGVRGGALVLLICVLFAISDEIHQIFVPGRGAELRDVLIDSAGASMGILLYLLMSRLLKKSRL